MIQSFMKQITLFLLAVSVIFISCSITRSAESNLRPLENAEMLEGEWIVEVLYGEEIVDKTEQPTLTFNLAEKRVSGFTSCNRVIGSYVFDMAQPSSISFSELATTLMACADGNVEAKYLEGINSTSSIFQNKEESTTKLVLVDAQGEETMVLKKKI